MAIRWQAAQRQVLWGLLEWGTGGLGPFKIDAIIQAVDADAETWKYLKYFCQAVEEGQITTCPTVKLIGVNALDAAVKQGKWIYRLTLLLGGMIKLVMPRSVFEELIEDESVAEKFEEYCEACKPVLQTPTGKEFSSFKTLVKVEKADVLGTYKPALPEIRNLHRFSKAALDKLVKDKGQKDKPLTLVLYSMFDHNGAFNRDYATETVILNDNIRVFVVEGMDVSRVQGLTAGGLTKTGHRAREWTARSPRSSWRGTPVDQHRDGRRRYHDRSDYRPKDKAKKTSLRRRSGSPHLPEASRTYKLLRGQGLRPVLD